MGLRFYWCRMCKTSQEGMRGRTKTCVFDEGSTPTPMFWCEVCQKWRVQQHLPPPANLGDES